MGFSGFLGNDSVKSRLSGSVNSGKLSHSYIISGPKGSGKKTLAKLIAAAMQCTAEKDKPCLTCNQCRKVMEGIHPDVVVVDEEDKKAVSVKLARWAKEDLYIRPNEGNKKIYVFPQELRHEAQNALLKVVEEPPAYGAFLFLSEKAESLLTTIRSRSVELMLSPVPKEEAIAYLQKKYPKKELPDLLFAWNRAGGFLGTAEALLKKGERFDERAIAICEAFAAGDRMALMVPLVKMEKIKREQLIPILRQCLDIMAQAMTAKAGRTVSDTAKRLADSKTAAQLLQACQSLRQAVESAEANGGVGYICGFLAVRLR